MPTIGAGYGPGPDNGYPEYARSTSPPPPSFARFACQAQPERSRDQRLDPCRLPGSHRRHGIRKKKTTSPLLRTPHEEAGWH